MRWLKLVYLLLGCGLLGFVAWTTDLEAVVRQVSRIGGAGVAAVLAIHLLVFLTDVWAWQLTFESLPPTLRWLSRLFLVRLVGEAVNQVSIVASIGGETVKAVLLKTHYRIGYRESGASLVLSKTLDLIALVVFLAVGFGFVLLSDRLSGRFKLVAGVGLAAFALAVAGFFLVQRLRLVSRAGRRFPGSRFGARLTRLARAAAETEEMLATFYTRRRRRFRSALAVALLNWVLSMVELYCLLSFLGHPVSVGDAWIIDAVGQLVVAGAFFVPLGLGVQEGGLVVVCGAITGDPALGFAVAMVRRFREVVWLVAGVAVWWLLSLGQRVPDAEPVTPLETSGEAV
jgi:uncharacterized protein (TIRG00374 family)